MNSTERLTNGSTVTGFPPLQQPKPEIADRGAVRLGEACITAEFPPLRQPKAEGLDISDDTTSKVYSSFFDNDTTRSENHTGENGETTTRSMRTETSALT